MSTDVVVDGRSKQELLKHVPNLGIIPPAREQKFDNTFTHSRPRVIDTSKIIISGDLNANPASPEGIKTKIITEFTEN